ncbi:hypothetical protein [Streptomyces sp. NPDC052494]|uniref:hypothetical protein n=1 Tax=Streptomyces sp. NPDC052494 TaxID=3365692 RepID=UPI0037D91669
MLIQHHEYDVVVTAVASVGSAVLADGREGFIDQAKHPSWWSDTPRAGVGDRMRAVVLDATRTPPRLSALPSDIRIARSLRHTEPLERLCPPPPLSSGRDVKWALSAPHIVPCTAMPYRAGTPASAETGVPRPPRSRSVGAKWPLVLDESSR